MDHRLIFFSIFVSQKKRTLHRDVLFTLSNIAAGTSEQISALLRVRPLMLRVVELAEDSPSDVMKEALWTITNIATLGDLSQANSVVLYGSMHAFCRFLDPPRDSKMVLVVLEAIEKLLEYNLATELGYVDIIEESNGVKLLEELQTYDNECVYEATVRILKKYFNGEEEEVEDQNIVPRRSEGDATFEFGIGTLPSKQLFPEKFGNPAPATRSSFGGNFSMNAGHRY